MAKQLSDRAKELFDGKNFVTISTIEPDGSVQLSVVWAKTDGDDILVSTLVGRRKHSNLVRDPRVTLLLSPADAPYSYVEVRGEATVTAEGGRELIDELSNKYVARDYGIEPPEAVRVVVRVSPHRIVEHGF